MSLIHDSLRKLENKPVNGGVASYDCNSVESYMENSNYSNRSKLWFIISLVSAITLIVVIYNYINRDHQSHNILEQNKIDLSINENRLNQIQIHNAKKLN